jgi:tyrosyl-tRNA synthetase
VAEQADSEWLRVHSARELPSEMPEFVLGADTARDGKVWICRLLVATGMAKSNGEARRLVEQGGVLLNGAKQTDANAEIALETLQDAVLQVGPKRYVRLKV